MVRSTNNSLATMSSTVDSPMVPSTVPVNSSTAAGNSSTAPETSASTSHLSVDSGVLAQAFSRALGESLPNIFASFQAQIGANSSARASEVQSLTPSVPVATTSLGVDSSSHLAVSQASAGNLNVPSFISTYCTLADPQVSVSTQSYGPINTSMRARGASTSQCSLSPQSALPTENVSPFSGKAFVIGPGYAPVPYKVVSKVISGQFTELADLLAENIKAQDTEPQAFLEGKLLVSTSKKRVVEITDILSWVEAFTIYSLILCNAYPSRWPDLNQYKLLIIQTARRFPALAWLHYDVAFRKEAAATGLTDWSRMNLDRYNFHTRASSSLSTPPTQVNQPRQATSATPQSFPDNRRSLATTQYCHSWNDGNCRWPFGRCRFRHACESCDGEHPKINCPYRGSNAKRRVRSPSPLLSKRRR